MTPGEVGIVAVPIVVGFILSMLITWTPRPMSVNTKTMVVASIVVLTLTVSVTLAVSYLTDQPSGVPATSEAAMPPSASGGSVSTIAPDLADRRILSTDDSTGSYVLFSSGLAGGNRQRVSTELGGPVEPVPGTSQVIVAWHGDGRHGSLEVRELTGERVRSLTDPPLGHEDSSPSLAADAGIVYFVRSQVRDLGGGTSDTVDGWVMRVPLDGSAPAVRVELSQRLFTVSTDDSGTVLAGVCDDPSHVGQACLRTQGQPNLRHIPGSEGTTMSDVHVSPDGKRVAYASFYASPFGGERVYSFDVAAATTTNMSQLAGHSSQPSWARDSAQPCLLFSNDPSGTDPAVYLSCLTPKPRQVQVLPVGRYPRWLQL